MPDSGTTAFRDATRKRILPYAKRGTQMDDPQAEYRKLLAGEPHLQPDPYTGELQEQARRRLKAFNDTPMDDFSARLAALSALFGRQANCLILSPFHCDYGIHIEIGTSFCELHVPRFQSHHDRQSCALRHRRSASCCRPSRTSDRSVFAVAADAGVSLSRSRFGQAHRDRGFLLDRRRDDCPRWCHHRSRHHGRRGQRGD